MSQLAQLALKSGKTSDMKKALAAITDLSYEGVTEIMSFVNGLESQEADWHELIAEFRRYANSILEPQGVPIPLKFPVDGKFYSACHLCRHI
jgi:signal transduction histidine kinase